MIKKTGILALAVYLFLVLLSPVLVHAQSELTILDSSVQAEFPSRLSFNLSVASDVNITDIRLRYTVDRSGFAQVTSEVYIEFAPSITVDVSWTLEMVKIGGLPPGSSVDYWWVVKDTSGDRIETAPSRIRFDDNRYSWRSLAEGEVTIYWYEGNGSFAREIMLSAQQALARLTEDTGAYLEKPVKLYIYAKPQDLRGAMIYSQEWTGGRAFTKYGTIAIGIAQDNLSWGKSAIAHELAHLVIGQITLNPYGDLPTWLNEGLAMYAEGALESGYVTSLNKAIGEKSLISVHSLSSSFSAFAEEALLAYAQSYSLVEFLIGNYGQDKMFELLNTFRQGSSYDDALEQVYGLNMDGLNTLWQDYVTMPATQSIEKKGMHPALTPTLATLAIALLLTLGLATESRTWGQD